MNKELDYQPNERKKWGFQIPTCIIDAQSAPALAGVEPEQKYMRAFLMAGKADLVVTDFPLNDQYIFGYLKDVLHFELPNFMVIPNLDQPTLTGNLLNQPANVDAVQGWIQKYNGQLLFFNTSQNEIALAHALQNPPLVCGNIEETIAIGSKTGFRRMCGEIGLPIPEGVVCTTSTDTIIAVAHIISKHGSGFIKAKDGTGGTDLQSNIPISATELKNSGYTIEEYVAKKLAYFGPLLGDEWVVETMVEGSDGSVHVYIDPNSGATKTYVLGAISHDNSYAGGYAPYPMTPNEIAMVSLVNERFIPVLKRDGLTGFHCLDFKGQYFLEDNARPGALDFIDQFVCRIVEKHFTDLPYSWYHCHVPMPRATTFEEIYPIIADRLDPTKHTNGCFAAVSNVEILPYGRALDLTAICVGDDTSVDRAQDYFMETAAFIKEHI